MIREFEVCTVLGILSEQSSARVLAGILRVQEKDTWGPEAMLRKMPETVVESPCLSSMTRTHGASRETPLPSSQPHARALPRWAAGQGSLGHVAHRLHDAGRQGRARGGEAGPRKEHTVLGTVINVHRPPTLVHRCDEMPIKASRMIGFITKNKDLRITRAIRKKKKEEVCVGVPSTTQAQCFTRRTRRSFSQR